MLLRRFINHVKHENWLAVFLDFIVVVLGIFVALQVTEWKDNNNLKQLAIKSLEQAKVEAIENNRLLTSYLQKAKKYEKVFHKNMENLLRCDGISDNQETFNESFDLFMYNFAINTNAIALQQLYTQSFYPLYKDDFITLLNEFTGINKQYSTDIKENSFISWNTWPFNKSPYFIKNISTSNIHYFTQYKIRANFKDICQDQQSVNDIHHAQLSRMANYSMYRELIENIAKFIPAIDKQIDLIKSE